MNAKYQIWKRKKFYEKSKLETLSCKFKEKCISLLRSLQNSFLHTFILLMFQTVPVFKVK